MLRFLIRSVVSTIITLTLVSIGLFGLVEVGSGDIAQKILGIFSTPEQREIFNRKMGLDAPVWQRYLDWLIGSDFRAESKLGKSLVVTKNPKTHQLSWWVDLEDGSFGRWKAEDDGLVLIRKSPDGSLSREPQPLKITEKDQETSFWGIDEEGSAIRWVRKPDAAQVQAVQYIPLKKGLLRLDPGISLQYGRPVAKLIAPRIRNTLVLAMAAFLLIMPLALLLGIIAGINEGKPLDRLISITGMGITAIPEFVTGIFLILIFGVWWKILPAVTIFSSPDAIFSNPKMLILPVMTLSAMELGYVSRMTRASMVEVMGSQYIRTAFVKGMPYWRVIWFHAVRNALMTPITVIMLHVNWLIGGVVVTEIIFGYPGLGKFIYEAAIFGDYAAIEAAAMVTVAIAILTRLIGDFSYTLINPRIRYS